MFNNIDVLIVGAGLAGIVCAERMAHAGKRVLIIERKHHVGGHCYDYLNESGIYIHLYGPHIFHTDNEKVWRYLSHFTEWYHYQHTVLGLVDGHMVPIPFNLNSMERLFSPTLFSRLEKKLIDEFGYNSKIPILELRQKNDEDLRFLAEYIYDKVFLTYTLKQWGVRPEEIDPAVSGRVPVAISRDNRYFYNTYQGIPLKGYTALLKKMLDHPKIHLLMNTNGKDFFSIQDNRLHFNGGIFSGAVIYTGMIDELCGYDNGRLPYRSVRIQFEDVPQPFFQENALVNYPSNYDFTRITEFKYFQQNAGQLPFTTICREYPETFEEGKNNPYYIIATEENIRTYEKYVKKVDAIPNLYMVGRLAHYKYYDMDQVVEAALAVSEKIIRES